MLRACDMEVNNTSCRRVLSRVGGPGFQQRLLPRGRKARCLLSGRGGGATRPPATLSCKADPGDYPAGLALPYCWQRTKFRTNRRYICGWQVSPYKTIVGGGFFFWPESGDPFKKSRKMKFHDIRFRPHFCERHRKTIHMAFGISKNGLKFAVWRRVQVAKKRQFSKRGSSGDANRAAPVAHLAF